MTRAKWLWAVVLLGCRAQEVSDAAVAYLAEALEASELQTVLVVAPGGAGDACSDAEPCALDTGRALLARLAPGAEADLTLELKGGVYRLGAPLRLGQPAHASLLIT